ncbi:MAG: Type IV secretory system Conjugative DNA transfer [Alphaproteobacteria bacterium ADurb.Bin438]|nr:MAG: Type IV secretory system Conjugative DNA transfer [Alphaproteobacteria bacterium ADurb.Bin438]
MVFYLSSTLIIIPLTYVIKSFDMAGLNALKQYYIIVFTEDPFVCMLYYVKWFIDFGTYSDERPILWLPVLPLSALVTIPFYTYFTNPYKFGFRAPFEAKNPSSSETKKMGLFGSKYYFFGYYKEKALKTDGPDSVMLLGTTGAGKTHSVILPSILESDSATIISNDYTSEYYVMTSGYRATFSQVYRYQWDKLEDASKGVFHPNINFISPKNMPPLSTARAGYIAGIVLMLIPDGRNADPYWSKNGRAALEGYVTYLIDKVAQAKANDYFIYKLLEGEALDEEDLSVLESYYKGMEQGPHIEEALKNVRNNTITYENYEPIGTWEHIPKAWRGREASFGMLVDFIASYQIAMSTEIKAKRDMGDMLAQKEDPLTKVMTAMLDEAVHFGYSRRARLEVGLLLATPAVQRSSIISVAFSGLSAFKNPAVRQRTSSSDFYFSDLRGKLDKKTGEWKPLTIYIMNNHPVTSVINAMFFNLMCEYVLHYPPNSPGHGPLDVLFIMDNFSFLPKVRNLFYAFGTGKSKGVGFLLSVMSLNDIASSYGGPEGVSVFITKAAIKIIKMVNNEKVTARFSAMSGKKTMWNVSGYSRPHFLGTPKNYFEKKVSEKMREKAGLSKGKMNNIDPKTAFILVQNYLNRPIKAKNTDACKDERFAAKTKLPVSKAVEDEIVKSRPPEEVNIPMDLQFDIDGEIPIKLGGDDHHIT